MKLLKIAGGIFFLLKISLGYSSAPGPVPLETALAKGWVKCRIYSASADTNANLPSRYYGQCIRLSLENRSENPLSIALENGHFLEPADSLEQRMIVTRQELISLAPGKKRVIPVYAMCTQMHERSPGPETLLALGKMAEGLLLQLAGFIGKNNYQDQSGQEAIWVITDGSSLGDIYSEDANELKNLQEFLSKLTGKIVPPAPNRITYSSGEVSGEIVFENTGKETYSFFMTDESGQTIGTFFENRTIYEPRVTSLSWKFRFKGFPMGVYYVKLVTSKGTSVACRPVMIN